VAELQRSRIDPARLAGFAGLILCILAFWMVQHPYMGLINDATLYAVAALARLHPESLGHDIFLSQGSQDHYTLYSPIVAVVIRIAGVANAAALLTFSAQIGFFGCAWLLVRRLMPVSMALLAIALLVAIPGIYGGDSVFTYSESLLTPRVPAEALVLAALASVLSRRYLVTAACIVAAALLHPLMAAAGLVMLALLVTGAQQLRIAFAVAVLLGVLLALAAYLTPFGPVARFDPEWFEMLHSRLKYVFPSLWPLSDWARASVPLATLAVGAISATQPTIRSVSRAALLTGLSGLALSLIASDLLHIIVVTQVQTWRWLWLANATAVILIPVIVAELWQAGSLTRAAIVLLGASWICSTQNFALITALLAVTACAAAPRVTQERTRRLVMLGAWLGFALSVLIFGGLLLTALRKPPSAPLLVNVWSSRGVVPAAVLAFLWWWLARGRPGVQVIAVPILGLGLCAVFTPVALPTWTHLEPSDKVYAQFEGWRRQIPPSAQVLAPGVPLIPWFLLERPSYWSLRQMAGVMFSRETTMELLRRESAILDREKTGEMPRDPIATCRTSPTLGFIVTPADVAPTPFAPVSIGQDRSDAKDRPDSSLHLYRCADYRGS
jgi:hypothetical protein